jgi:4-oxalocrotonate tautomerase
MPILNVTVSSSPERLPSSQVAALLLRHTEQILHKDPALTSIAVRYQDPVDWHVGADSLAALGKGSFFLDIKISDETNTAAEKAAYIEAVFHGMALLVGELHEVSYIHIDDARPAAWGWGGQTQQVRAVRKLAL